MQKKIFIVDDHYMVIAGIRSLLEDEKDIEWTGHATNASSCLAFLRQYQPDVILMDVNLPDKSGIDLCTEVKSKYPSIFILGLSTFNQQSIIQKMMDNGASGYILKNATKEEILEAINVVIKGKTYLSFEVSQTMKNKSVNEFFLTPREKEVLQLIAEGLTNNEVAQKLFISPTTVDTHRKNLLAKFEVKNTAMLIRMAVEKQLI